MKKDFIYIRICDGMNLSKTKIILKDKCNKIVYEEIIVNLNNIKIPICHNDIYKLFIISGLKIIVIPLIAKRDEIYCININNNFSSVDYDNLYLYAKDRAKLMHGEELEVKLSRNPPFDRTLLIKTPMDKALFINDSSAKGAIKGRLKMNNKKNKKKINMQDMTKLNFYLMYLELLDKEINKTKNIELKDELIIAKYRLMYVLDSIYDLMNFKKRESSIKINGDYSFIETIIYFFTVEVLSYDDKEYKLDGTNKKDIITYYFNIIKKLYVETYYKLTNDRVIIDLINNSNFYNVNTISSKLFSNIVPSEKNKSKIKKKNF